jgi:magnesium chelatase family protein
MLDSLHQPLETGAVMVAHVNAPVNYPARDQLIAAVNPCRCGYLDDPARACSRAPRCAANYQAKISGPLFHRIDLQVEVPEVSAAGLADAEPSGASVIRTNAQADGKLLEKVAAPDEAGRAMLGEAVDKTGLSARGYHRVLRAARTLADLKGVDGV